METFKLSFTLFMSFEFEFRSRKCTPVNWQRVWHQSSIFSTIFSAGANCKFTQLVDLQISVWVFTIDYHARMSVQEQLKKNQINFAILNSHVTNLSKALIFMRQSWEIKNSCILYYLYLYIGCDFFQARKLLVKWNGNENLRFLNLLIK